MIIDSFSLRGRNNNNSGNGSRPGFLQRFRGRSSAAPTPYTVSSMRTAIAVSSGLFALYHLMCAVGNFRTASAYKDNGFNNLATLSIVLGSLCMGVLFCEIIGVAAAGTQKVPVARIYALASVFALLIVLAMGILNVVVHFTMKSTIINACVTISDLPSGFMGFGSNNGFPDSETQQLCKELYDHDSWASILSLLIMVGVATFLCAIAWKYFRLLRNPPVVEPSNVQFPSAPYNGPAPTYMTASAPPPVYMSGRPGVTQFAPPSGPPPNFTSEKEKEAYGENPFADFESGAGKV